MKRRNKVLIRFLAALGLIYLLLQDHASDIIYLYANF